MKAVRYLLLAWCLGLWLCPPGVWGQETPHAGRGEGFQEECPTAAPEGECPSTFGPIITDTAIPAEKGTFVVQPTFYLGFVTANFSPSWRRVDAGGDFSTFRTDLKLTYGLISNMEVYVVIPYVHNWASRVTEPGPQGERSADFGGLGDVNLNLKYQFIQEGPVAPAVSALATFGFPSGHYRHLNPGRLGTDLLGSGSYTFTLGLNMSKYVSPVILYGNIWYTTSTDYTTREDRPTFFWDEDGELAEGDPVSTKVRKHPRDYVTINLAAEYPLTKKWVALLELYSYWDGGRLFGHKANMAPTAKLSVLPGIEYMATDKLAFALGVGIDLIGKNTDASVTPMFSFFYNF